MSLALKDTYGWDQLMQEVCQKIGASTGNVLTEKQRPMVESRMKRRLLDLRLKTPLEYREYWLSHPDDENKYLVGLLTTHFTSFFREFSHFEWIGAELPLLVRAAKSEGRNTLKFWSAACSKGQEVWSLSMWLHHHMPKIDPSMNWSVYGTDIDASSSKEGENAVYHRRELETSPRHLWEGLWVKGKDDIADWYKVKAELRNHAKFGTDNLLDLKLSKNEKFDIIMCRNVLIYFDRANQEKVATSLLKYLSPQGALITGMSESLNGYGLGLKCASPSVYRSADAKVIELPVLKKITQTQLSTPILPKPLKVFCIDDSATVITILKKIFKTADFEVIGTATNGQDAIEKLKTLKPDVITLDIHMPVMDGPSFLKTSGIAKNTPVVMVSSVDRDDSSLVLPLFDLGVCDFIEKPTISNMSQMAEELGQKLKMGWIAKNKNISVTSSREVSKIKPSSHGHIIFNVDEKDRLHLHLVLKQQNWANHEMTIIISNAHNLENFKKECSDILKSDKKICFQTDDRPIQTLLPTIWLQFQSAAAYPLHKLKKPNYLVVVEETSNLDKSIKEIADDVSPCTSFSYLVEKLLSGR